MSQKYFPIVTETACQLKWTWSTIHLYSGETKSCHRVGSSVISPETFDTFHNTPKKIADRELMLAGLWPQGGCEYCQNMEAVGGQSDRQFHLQIPDLIPPELEADSSATIVSPRILEVYLDNVCNMSCIYCEDKFSSRIQKENEKFGPFEQAGVKIVNRITKHPRYTEMQQQFWKWLENNYQTLSRFHILGGEPFYQLQFDQCLNFWNTHPNPNLELNIVTNLKLSEQKLESYVEIFKKLLVNRCVKRVDITCSIDCWGAEQEYIRYGIDMAQWQKNFEYLAKHKWITLNINQTITSLGLSSMPLLIKFINQHRQYRNIQQYHMAVNGVSHLHPDIFGAGFFDQEFSRILAVMPDKTWDEQNCRSMMHTLQLQCNAKQRNTDELYKLRVFLTEIDRRRNLNWTETFPWLTKELEHVV